MQKTNQKKKTSPVVQTEFVLQLNQNEVDNLNRLLNEIPGKYCNPLFEYFNMIIQKRNLEQQNVKVDETKDLLSKD